MKSIRPLFVFPFVWLFACQSEITDKDSIGLTDTSEDTDSSDTSSNDDYVNPDFNSDGNINILVLGTRASIVSGQPFLPETIASELGSILEGDSNIIGEVNVVSENIHSSKDITIGLGGNGAEYTYTHHRHSLTQYYYWPEEMASMIGITLSSLRTLILCPIHLVCMHWVRTRWLKQLWKETLNRCW